MAVVAAGSRNTRYRAARYGLTRPVFHRLDRASLLAPSQSQAQGPGSYWKVIMSVRLRVVALGFKGAFAKFALPEFKTL